MYVQIERYTDTNRACLQLIVLRAPKAVAEQVAFEDNMQFHVSSHFPYLGIQKNSLDSCNVGRETHFL